MRVREKEVEHYAKRKDEIMSNRFSIVQGDCQDVLKKLRDSCIDAIVTDPPYGLSKEPDMAEVLKHWLNGDNYKHKGSGFMGKSWDSFVPGPFIWREIHRVLKPGGHVLSFFGTRTYDMGVIAMRLAGFEVRDQIDWVYGSGFPKSLNIGEGRGTALKPAHEPIVLARKPLVGTVAVNVVQFGTGALNIDGCRVPIVGDRRSPTGADGIVHRTTGNTYGEHAKSEGFDTSQARWPANVLHDGSDEVEAAFAAFGESKSRVSMRGERHGSVYGGGKGPEGPDTLRGHGDAGTPSRFFYCAKASKADRDDGLSELPKRERDAQYGSVQDARPHTTNGYKYHREPRRNHHPTVKPTALMRYLCRLITPPDGIILDPFCGTGSTGRGAMLEGFRFLGIEMEKEYAEMARLRIEAILKSEGSLDPVTDGPNEHPNLVRG